jgi:hypothetical protein
MTAVDISILIFILLLLVFIGKKLLPIIIVALAIFFVLRFVFGL